MAEIKEIKEEAKETEQKEIKQEARRVKEKDFIELEYTGKIKEDNFVFDTTDEEIAKKHNLFNKLKERKCHPIIICVGQHQIINGLDKALIGKELEKEYTIEIPIEEAYGKRNSKLIQLIQTSKFQKRNIRPIVGLQVSVDNRLGVIKTISGGRTLVDFNHPLAGKDVIYGIKINRIITDSKEKINSILNISLGIEDAAINIEYKKVMISIQQKIPEVLKEQLKKKIKELLPDIEEIII